MLAAGIQNPVTPNINSLSPTGFFSSLLGVLMNALFIFAAVFFFFRLILGGIAWTTSAGDKSKLEQAKQQVLNAIIGIVLVLSTFIIINFLAAIFNVELTNFDLNALQV